MGLITAKLTIDKNLRELHLENTKLFLGATKGGKPTSQETLWTFSHREVFLSAAFPLSVAQLYERCLRRLTFPSDIFTL